MALTQAICSSFKKELLEGIHNFAAVGGDVFKLALYTGGATLDASTTVYTTSGETTGVGYSAGGIALTNVGVSVSGTVAYLDFDDATWTGATLSAAGGLIYNSSEGNKAVAVLNFGGTYTSTSSDFTVSFPAATSSTAVIILN